MKCVEEEEAENKRNPDRREEKWDTDETLRSIHTSGKDDETRRLRQR